MKECWAPILGFRNYRISNFGRVLSLDYNNEGYEKILVPGHVHGYLKIGLYKNGRCFTKRIHRLVAAAFLGPSDETVNHKDGNKYNNRLDNLEYCTLTANVRHAWRTGLAKKQLGENTSGSKLTNKQVSEIKTMINKGITNKCIAELFGVDASLISHIKRGFVWGHINA